MVREDRGLCLKSLGSRCLHPSADPRPCVLGPLPSPVRAPGWLMRLDGPHCVWREESRTTTWLTGLSHSVGGVCAPALSVRLYICGPVHPSTRVPTWLRRVDGSQNGQMISEYILVLNHNGRVWLKSSSSVSNGTLCKVNQETVWRKRNWSDSDKSPVKSLVWRWGYKKHKHKKSSY